MKNVVLWGWSEADAVLSVKNLGANPNINIVAWIADFEPLETFAISYKKFLYNHPDLGVFKSIPCGGALSDSEVVKFLHMFSREKRSRGIDFHEQVNIAKNYFRYFLFFLKKNNVDCILFSMIPIIGYDYLCYLAAKRLGLKVVMCYQSLFPNRFFYAKTLEDFGLFYEIDERPEVPPLVEWGYEKDLFYMKGNIIASRTPNSLINFLKETWRHGFRTSSKPMRYSGVIDNFVQSKDFFKYYDSISKSAKEINVNINYVYFPLHLQPELTTTGFGGEYSDQLDALERLSELLPIGWKIYVKENPKQGHEQRGREFYRRLMSIEGIEYIAKEVDTYWLMKNCRFVATITGTAGWESITGGKPCLFFGLAWFSCIPGAVQYKDDITVEDIIHTSIIPQEQMLEFSKLYNKMRYGIVDDGYRSIYPMYDSLNNSKNLLDFMEYEIFND